MLSTTAAFSFGAYPLGLMDMNGVSPYHGLVHGGQGSHLLVPTMILQRWADYRASSPVRGLLRLPNVDGDAHFGDLGGGVVRVVACNSDFLNALYPANVTTSLPARARALLRDAGHLGQQFAPTPRRIIRPEVRARLPRWRAGSGLPFVAYTLPALELRRMLHEAREANESFTLTYDRLPRAAPEGDAREAWRRTAVAATVVLKEDGRGGRRCRVRERITAIGGGARWGGWHRCAEDELAMQPPPEASLLMKMLLFLPYPILPGSDAVPCVQ